MGLQPAFTLHDFCTQPHRHIYCRTWSQQNKHLSFSLPEPRPWTPQPSWPMRLDLGTLTSSKSKKVVPWQLSNCMSIFLCFRSATRRPQGLQSKTATGAAGSSCLSNQLGTYPGYTMLLYHLIMIYSHINGISITWYIYIHYTLVIYYLCYTIIVIFPINIPLCHYRYPLVNIAIAVENHQPGDRTERAIPWLC